MINDNVLVTLNKYGFGANIDSLEDYILNYNMAKRVADVTKYKYKYDTLYKILKTVKPASQALAFETEQYIEFDTLDTLFIKVRNPGCDTLYGDVNKAKLDSIVDYTYVDKDIMDIVGIHNVEGIDVVCLYSYGELCSIYAVSDTNKVYDFTDQLYDKLRDFIPEFNDFTLIELRAKVTLGDGVSIVHNTTCDTMGYLRTGIKLKNLKLVFNNIFIDDNEYTFESYWDKLSFLSEHGFEVPYYSLLRNISKTEFTVALKTLDNFFDTEVKDNGCNYRYNGFIAVNNAGVNSIENLLCYDTVNIDSEQEFESTLKEIVRQRGKLYAKILKTECNNKVCIDTVEIDDVYKLEEYGLNIGGRVKFKVAEGIAILSA